MLNIYCNGIKAVFHQWINKDIAMVIFSDGTTMSVDSEDIIFEMNEPEFDSFKRFQVDEEFNKQATNLL